VLEMLAELEVCDDYKYINQLIDNIAENAKKDTSIFQFYRVIYLILLKNRLRSLAINSQALIIYNNFNFKNSVRNQVLESSKSIMCNMTSALLVFCLKFSVTDFKQSMFNSSQSFSLNEILTSSEL